MQTNRVIVLYPQASVPDPALSRRSRKAARMFRRFAAIVDLAVTAAIGVGVLVCFGLVFTML